MSYRVRVVLALRGCCVMVLLLMLLLYRQGQHHHHVSPSLTMTLVGSVLACLIYTSVVVAVVVGSRI